MTKEIFETLQSSINDKALLTEVFSLVAIFRKKLQEKDADNLKRVFAEEYDELSLKLESTGLQESVSARNILRTRRIANLLVTDSGELNLTLLPQMIKYLKAYQYSLGKNRHYDALRQAHILKVLEDLQEKKELSTLLKTISKPHQHPIADEVIRSTLNLKHNVVVTDAHARRAALSALLTYLRQNIGSCFATAPAIIVHDEQPETFLKDVRELLATGRLKRVVEGVEHSAPICNSWGASDLRKPILLIYGQTSIWYSPGIILALESIEYFPSSFTEVEKSEKLKSDILSVLPEWSLKQPYLAVSAEEILKRVLLKHFSLKDEELEAYLNRPRDMIYSNMLFQPSHVSTSLGGKGNVCGHFINHFEEAKKSFKAVTENALLKVWEYTLASFAETKSDFARWNLYASLGLDPNEKGGIGEIIHEAIKLKLDYYNQKVADMQFEYEHLFSQVKQLESRIRHASDEKEAQWIRVEYQSKSNEFYAIEDVRNKYHQKGSTLARLFDIIMDQYDQLFPQYFQEVYDPDLHEIKVSFYDDSPAGFRLLFKHGRQNTSQWTRIFSAHEYVESLIKFFVATETPLKALDTLAPVQEDLSDIITQIVHHIRRDEFLESAFYRMAVAHQTHPFKDPLNHLDQIPMKPWCYISGGTMNTLLMSYFRLEEKPFEVGRWVENPMELLVFFVDTLKQVPFKQMEDFEKLPYKSMLVHSPTHAFLLKPGLPLFKRAWQTESFTYTWARDHLILPIERFVDNLKLDEEMQNFLIDELSQSIPQHLSSLFRKVFINMPGKAGTLSSQDFRELILEYIDKEKSLQYRGQSVLTSDEIDRVLYENVPFSFKSELKQNVELIFKKIGKLKREGKDAKELLDSVSNLSDESQKMVKEMSEVEEKFNFTLASLPNVPMDDIPVAELPKDNVVIKEFGKKREFNFAFKNHVELNEKLNLFDFKRGAKISGTGWPVYRNLGARLEWALINYMMKIHIKNGFMQWIPPLLVRKETVYGSGQLPKFENQQFKITDEDYNLYLIPTAEVPLNGLHSDEIFSEEDLPLKYVAYTPCFRREAGAAGSSERGLIRVHQFNKVEMFAFAKPGDSESIFNRMLKSAEEILEGLELHFRHMLLVTGDMSFAAAKTVDVEVWLPGQNRYYEVSSVSNCTDYQSRRSKIRFKNKEGKLEFVHTLNGSGLATSRLMVALLENNQNEDGSINVPKALQEYLDGLTVIS